MCKNLGKKMKNGLHSILYILCFLVCLSCRKQEKETSFNFYDYDLKISILNDSTVADPLRMSERLDRLITEEEDSFSYYGLLVIQAKAKMLLAQNDSSDILLHRVEEYCKRNRGVEHMEYLRMLVLNTRGNLFCRKAAFDSAVMVFSGACDIGRKQGYRNRLVDLSANLADAYLNSGHYDLSSYWYRYSLLLSDSLQIPEEQRFATYGGLAQLNMELRNFETCDSYFELAGKYYEKMTPHEKRVYLNNRGNSYYYRRDYPSSLQYFRRLLAFLHRYPEMEFERNVTMINIGDVFLSMGQIDSASYYLSRCYYFFQKEKNNSALYYIDTQLIELALKQGDLQLAKERLQHAVTPNYVEPNMVHIRNRYLQHYFEKAGDFKNAYYFLQKNQRIDDSTRNERVKMRAAEIALKYRQDSTLMKKEILIGQKQNEVLRLNQWLYRIVVAVLVLGGVLLVVVFYRKRKRDRERWKMQQTMTSLRLDNIRNRISPHFIFNVLNREVALHKEESDNLLGLAKLIRKNLEFTSHMAVPLADELDFVNTYLQLESRTLRDDFEYVQDIAPEVDLNEVQVPSMMLQIPVENAIKHALRGKEGKQKLWISIKKKIEEIEIVICDNGGGYRPHSASRGTGTGMKVITQTIQLLNSYNHRQITMVINNVPTGDGETGCEIRFIVPLIYSYQLKGK